MTRRARLLLAWPTTLGITGLAGITLTDRLGPLGLVASVLLGLVAGTVTTMWADR